jgi:hypothetical protein
MPDIKMVVGPNGQLSAPLIPRKVHPNFTTSSQTLGSLAPEVDARQQYRFFPCSSTFTNQFSAGNYRSYSLSTAKDEAPHRVEYFSTP